MSANHINDQDVPDQNSDDLDTNYEASYEDDASYTEDASDDWSDADLAEEEGAEPAEQPAKKKRSTFSTIIILVVVTIAVFGFLILKGGSGVPVEQAAQPSATVIDADPSAAAAMPQNDLPNGAPEQQAAADAAAQPQQGLMDNPALLQDVAPTPEAVMPTSEQLANPSSPNAPAATAALAGEVENGQIASPTAVPAEVATAITPDVKPVSDFPTAEDIKKPESAEQIAPVAAVPVDTSLQNEKMREVQSQLDAAEKKIDDLQKDIALKDAQIAAEKKKQLEVTQNLENLSANKQEVSALRSKIAELEEKLASKEQSVSSVPAPKAERTPRVSEPVVSQAPVIEKVAPAQKQAVKKSAWVLKGASSGRALLSDKATSDTRSVRVGDVVPGLGRILSITDTGSAWVVKGTLGSVSE